MKVEILLLAAAVAIVFFIGGYVAAPKQPAVYQVNDISVRNTTLAPENYDTAMLVIPAVDDNNTGKLAELVVQLRSGKGMVFIAFNYNNPIMDNETQESLKTAIDVAERYALRDPSLYDLHYSMSAPASSVGGGSAGAAMTIATMAVLQGRTLRNDTAITGTISEDGSIGPVGGVLAKAQAIKAAGYTRFIVPIGESTTQVMQDVCTEKTTDNSVFKACNSQPVTVSIANETGLDVMEASKITDAFSMIAN